MRSKIFYVLLGFCGFLSLNCATTSAPAKWLPDKTASEKDAFGGWATVETKSDKIIRGELLAVSDSGIFLMPDNNVLFVGIDSVQKIKIGKYEDENPIAGWGTVGTLSTVSHGFVLMISAPVWILSSSLIAADYASQKVMFYPDSSLQALRSYARFPQGFPETINKNDLKPKFSSRISDSKKDHISDIKQNILANPFKLKLNGSIQLSSENKFTETLVAANFDVKDLFFIGIGISRNKYQSNDDINYVSILYDDKKYNYSPFLEIGKNFKMGTINPYIGASVYASVFDNGYTNKKEMYSFFAGANTLLGLTSFALQTEVKYLYISERPPFMSTQIYRPILLNIGMVYYF